MRFAPELRVILVIKCRHGIKYDSVQFLFAFVNLLKSLLVRLRHLVVTVAPLVLHVLDYERIVVYIANDIAIIVDELGPICC